MAVLEGVVFTAPLVLSTEDSTGLLDITGYVSLPLPYIGLDGLVAGSKAVVYPVMGSRQLSGADTIATSYKDDFYNRTVATELYDLGSVEVTTVLQIVVESLYLSPTAYTFDLTGMSGITIVPAPTIPDTLLPLTTINLVVEVKPVGDTRIYSTITLDSYTTIILQGNRQLPKETFNVKAAALYGKIQAGEGIQPEEQTTVTGSLFSLTLTELTGTDTSFLTELVVGDTLTLPNYGVIGIVDSLFSDTTVYLRNVPLLNLSDNSLTKGTDLGNPIAVLNFGYKREVSIETNTFVGSKYDRYEDISVTDSFAIITFEVQMPRLGTIAGSDPILSEVPLQEWFRACGLSIELSTDNSGSVTITNSTVNEEFITIYLSRTSSDGLATKIYKIVDCQGVIDLTGTISAKDLLRFTFQGNIESITEQAYIVPDFSNQTRRSLPVRRGSLDNLSEFVEYTSSSEPAILGSTNTCFDKFTIPNIAGLAYTRHMDSCRDTWTREGKATNISLRVVEHLAGHFFDPNSGLDKDFKIVIRNNGSTGTAIELVLHRVVLIKIDHDQIGMSVGQDLGLRNTGFTSIILS